MHKSSVSCAERVRFYTWQEEVTQKRQRKKIRFWGKISYYIKEWCTFKDIAFSHSLYLDIVPNTWKTNITVN